MQDIPKHISIYRTEETKSKLLSLYERPLATCAVPFEEHMVETYYGDTHVIASGPKQASATPVAAATATPVVLLHALELTLRYAGDLPNMGPTRPAQHTDIEIP